MDHQTNTGISGKYVLITRGTGSFGKAMVRHLLSVG